MIEHRSSSAVAIVGPGRVGQALGRLLTGAGVEIGWVAARRLATARQAVQFIGAGRAVALNSTSLAQAHVLLITTSDSALLRVSREIAQRRPSWKGTIVLHTSGAWPAAGNSSVLEPFRKRGASAGSLHPLQTIPSREAGVRNLAECFWAIEGDRAALQLARRWVRMLRGKAFVIDPDSKAAYHAAAVISCAGVVTLMETANRLLQFRGVAPVRARKALQAIVSETARNFAELGVPRALTGPAVRGDTETIKWHMAALQREMPDVVPLYRELNRQMLNLARRKKRYVATRERNSGTPRTGAFKRNKAPAKAPSGPFLSPPAVVT